MAARQRAPGAGRKPKPTALKKLHGTAQPCRMNPNEPTPQRGIPEAPAFLDDDERAYWSRVGEELFDVGVLTRLDEGALLLLVIARLRVERALVEVHRHGAGREKGRTGYAVELDKATASYRGLCAEFGMTPSARARVTGSPTEGADDGLDEFRGS